MTTFMELARTGVVQPEDVDYWVCCWHGGQCDEPLHDYLGLSWDDYAAWVADPTHIKAMLKP